MFQFELMTTPYAQRMRPVFLGMLCMLMVMVVARFVISDFWGAVSLIFVCLMGVFVLTGDYGISATNALFYCVMAIISGIFDAISCILYFQHSKYRMFDAKAPFIVLVAQAVFILSPLALFASASLSYSIYTDCRDRSADTLPILGAAFETPGFGVTDQGYQAAPPPRQNVRQPPQQPIHFSGRSYRVVE